MAARRRAGDSAPALARRHSAARSADESVKGDAGERGRRDQADLRLVRGQHGAGRAPGGGGRGREQQVHRGHAQAGGDADARAARDGGLDQQQADRAHLHRDREAGREPCDERGRQRP